MGKFEEVIKPALMNKTFAELSAEVLVESAKEEGNNLLAEALKNNQLRKFYDSVKQIERRTFRMAGTKALNQDILAQLVFLRPHLANAAEKARGKPEEYAMSRLHQVLDICLIPSVLKTKDDLSRFVKYFEAIVAYHK